MKTISICTLNGGGSKTLIRLYKSITTYLRHQLDNHDWIWNILIQGNYGCNDKYRDLIKRVLRHKVNFINVPNNIGVVNGTNELIDISKKQKYDLDVLWILDDDIEIISYSIMDLMLSALNTYKTCTTTSGWFGDTSTIQGPDDSVCTIPDHGSCCTMFHRIVLDKCGYYDRNIKQYMSDTEFNTRIKREFGVNSLSLLKGKHTKHYNQTGTFNCYTRREWKNIMAHDIAYVKSKKYISNYEKYK